LGGYYRDPLAKGLRMKLEQARVDFATLQKKIAAFKHATALIYYDGETSAPPDTLENRTRSLMVLNDELVKLTSGAETLDLLRYLEENKFELTVNERRAVEYMLKDYNRKKHIPEEVYVEYEKTLTEAQDAWHRACEEDNFDIAKPYLKKIFEYSRDFALGQNPDEDPYKYWLAIYEEGLEVETCDDVFSEIKNSITPLLKEVQKANINIKPVEGNFGAAEQEALSLYLLELLGINLDRVGFSTSDHSFTTFLGSHFDERIAVRFSKKDFTSSMYSVLHGAAHVLCDTGQADNLAFTVLDGSASMVILESQGHFYENIIGRSRTFIEHVYPELCALFPEYTKDNTVDDVYRFVNKAEPTLIRVDSDELTFNLHTMIRYELEKALIRDEMTVADIPVVWNDMYKEYLGLDVPNHAEGCLQDIHWPFGAIGYFPTYIIGNAYSVGFAKKMRETIDIEDCIAKGDFSEINEWNHQRIWQHGGVYTSGEIMKKFVQTSVDSKEYIRYLTDKYTDIYKL